MARIIDLKNRKPQLQEPVLQNRLSGPGVRVATASPHRPVRPKPQENPPPPRPVEAETPEPKAKVFSWSGPLYHHQPNVKVIVAVSVLFFGIAALMQIFRKDIISTIFFGLLGIMILLWANKKPKIAVFEITPMGVAAGERFFGFREIKSFWVEYEPMLGIKELSLQLKKWYYPYVKIPLDDQNPVQLRAVLLNFLPEVEHKDTLADAISRKLGI